MALEAPVKEIDFDAVEQHAHERIDQLKATVSRLSLDALIDPAKSKELEAAELELAHEQTQLARLELAKDERARRELLAEMERARLERERHLARAHEKQAERVQLAEEIDSAAAAYAVALRRFDRVSSEQGTALRLAGHEQAALAARPRPYEFEYALAYWLREAGCPHGILRLAALEPIPGEHQQLSTPTRHIKPLAAVQAPIPGETDNG